MIFVKTKSGIKIAIDPDRIIKVEPIDESSIKKHRGRGFLIYHETLEGYVHMIVLGPKEYYEKIRNKI